MRLTNYWWLLIWLFAAGAILHYYPKKYVKVNGHYEPRWDWIPAIILAAPYVIWAGYRGDISDTGLYRKLFLELPSDISQIPSFFVNDVKDPGFSVVQILIKNVIGNNDELFFLIVALFQIVLIIWIFRKYSKYYWLCLFLFISSTDYISWMQNGMRQFIAICMIFACTNWIVEKKYLPTIGIILLASSIHQSALLMIPIIFLVQGEAWNLKTLLFLVATMVVMIYVDRFTPILNDMLQSTQYDDMMTNEIWTNDDGTNMIRVLVYSVPALMSLVGLRYVREINNPLINVCVNCAIVTMALYGVASVSSGIYIGRLPMYTTLQGYIALPWLIEHMFTRKSAQFVTFAMVGLFVVFFYFQMGLTWGLL
ncbi:MAG: EpsG family protein [Erysipelotrichaceae bacterium]|nr:EpsG family protein [Erysipelotrichaceae bacterium]